MNYSKIVGCLKEDYLEISGHITFYNTRDSKSSTRHYGTACVYFISLLHLNSRSCYINYRCRLYINVWKSGREKRNGPKSGIRRKWAVMFLLYNPCFQLLKSVFFLALTWGIQLQERKMNL